MAAGSFGTHLVDVAAAPKSSLVSPGLLGFLVVVALALVLWALLRSMSKHLRKVQLADDSAELEADQTESASSGLTRSS